MVECLTQDAVELVSWGVRNEFVRHGKKYIVRYNYLQESTINFQHISVCSQDGSGIFLKSVAFHFEEVFVTW